MKKDRYFILACQHNAHYRKAWAISVFAITHEGPDEWKKDPYPCRLIKTPLGYSFINPDNTSELLPIEGADPSTALFKAKEHLMLEPGDIPNYSGTQAVETSYGNLLFNWVVLVFAFGKKIEYVNSAKPISIRALEEQIAAFAADDVEPGEVEDPGKIYMHEYLKYAQGVYHLKGFSWLFVWGATRKILLPPPGVKEFRDTLIEKYKDSLGETSTVAAIDAEMIKFDAAYLEGDPGLNFLIDKKTKITSRKKLFLIHGADVSLSSDTTKSTLIIPSLVEGMDITKFPDMMDGQRAGSYFRGAETMLGGVSAKELLRASSNINVLPGDCNSKLGIPTLVTKDYIKHLPNFSIIEDGVTLKIKDEEHAGTYLGKVVQVRSPAYCHFEHTDYCSTCCGDRLSLNKDGASIEIMGYGAAFLIMSLKKMHGNELAIAKMNYEEAIT